MYDAERSFFMAIVFCHPKLSITVHNKYALVDTEFAKIFHLKYKTVEYLI